MTTRHIDKTLKIDYYCIFFLILYKQNPVFVLFLPGTLIVFLFAQDMNNLHKNKYYTSNTIPIPFLMLSNKCAYAYHILT